MVHVFNTVLLKAKTKWILRRSWKHFPDSFRHHEEQDQTSQMGILASRWAACMFRHASCSRESANPVSVQGV